MCPRVQGWGHNRRASRGHGKVHGVTPKPGPTPRGVRFLTARQHLGVPRLCRGSADPSPPGTRGASWTLPATLTQGAPGRKHRAAGAGKARPRAHAPAPREVRAQPHPQTGSGAQRCCVTSGTFSRGPGGVAGPEFAGTLLFLNCGTDSLIFALLFCFIVYLLLFGVIISSNCISGNCTSFTGAGTGSERFHVSFQFPSRTVALGALTLNCLVVRFAQVTL